MGTAKRERQKANRAKRKLEEARAEESEKRKRTILQWGLGIGAAFVGVVVIAWLGGLFGGGDEEVATDDETLNSSPELATTAPNAEQSNGSAPDGSAPDGSVANDGATTGYGTGACPPEGGVEEPKQSFDDAPEQCIDPAADYTAKVSTNKGDLEIELDAADKPVTVNNFVTLARYRYFDDTQCHRIIQGFMAQCGDPTATGTGGPGYAISDELTGDETYERGTVAMANSGPDSAGSQFFVMVGDTDLPPDYTVFGQVAEGYDDTLDALEAAADPDAANGTPTAEDVFIESVEISQS